ncbi:MAG TPA: hypothetical protein VL371_09180 [Gemmataceae bacterium]|jgi:hypothetical protein|nr:hypothetical protein [Gemmataceae bacterium]
MPAQKECRRPTDPEVAERDRLSAAIGGHVLGVLGRPDDLFRVQVRRLWDDRYRVNVLVGPDAASTTIAHSYFLLVDEAGHVHTTSPAIRRQYDS